MTFKLISQFYPSTSNFFFGVKIGVTIGSKLKCLRMDFLPDDVIRVILSCITDAKELAKLQLVNKRLYHLCEHPSLWKNIFYELQPEHLNVRRYRL